MNYLNLKPEIYITGCIFLCFIWAVKWYLIISPSWASFNESRFESEIFMAFQERGYIVACEWEPAGRLEKWSLVYEKCSPGLRVSGHFLMLPAQGGCAGRSCAVELDGQLVS